MAKNKIITVDEAVKMIKDDMSIMVGGFNKCGVPLTFLTKLAKTNVKNLNMIKNDPDSDGFGIYDLLKNHQIKDLHCSHIGSNKECIRQMLKGETNIHLIPQGTFAERVRCGGAGLGGVLTQAGINTIAEEGKQIIEVEGKKYLLETPLRAEVSIIRASKVDKAGNAFYAKTAKNFNPYVAMAGDICIVEADEIVEVGEIDPHLVMTPGIIIDYIFKGEN